MQQNHNIHSNQSKEQQNAQIQQIQTKLEQINLKNANNIEDNQNKHEQNQQVQQNQDDQQEAQQQEQQQQVQQHKGNSKWKKVQQPQKNFDHCDSKKCSGKKLSRFKLLTQLDKKKKFKGIVLSAFGKNKYHTKIFNMHKNTAYVSQIVAGIESNKPDSSDINIKGNAIFYNRKLPFVTAGNPVNYGKPYQLSCAQALATALCAIGYIDQAEYIMSKFGWSDGFWSLNPLIENYGKCKTLEQLKIQSKKIEQSKTNSFQRNYDLSDLQSSEQQN